MDISISASVLTGVLTGAIAVVGNLIISAKTAGKTEGKIEEALKAINSRQDLSDKRQDQAEEDQRSQWSKIHEHTESIGYLKGRVNGGKANHAGSAG